MTETIKELASLEAGPARLIRELLERTGYRAWLEGVARASASADCRRAAARAIEGTREFAAAAAAFEERILEEEGAAPGSEEANALFLEELALMGEADELSGESGALSLMTLHAAKGLEFSAVGIVGAQEGLIPHVRALDAPASLDEERRLLYVGATRAKETLCLSWARERRPKGAEKSWAGRPSRFLEGIAPELLKRVGDHAPVLDGDPRRRSAPSDAAGARYAEILSDAASAAPRAGTGAESAVSPAALGPYAPGARVRHEKFGRGVVVERHGTGDRAVVSVDFEEAGRRKLVLNYARLSPAEESVDAGERPKV